MTTPDRHHFSFKILSPDSTPEFMGPTREVWTAEQATSENWMGTEEQANDELLRRCKVWGAFQDCFIREPLAIVHKKSPPC